MKFSNTSGFFVGELNELAMAYQDLIHDGKRVIELCSAVSGFSAAPQFPVELLKEGFAEGLRRSIAYEPDPMGNSQARIAVAKYYAAQGLQTNPDSVLLTCGSSLSYLYLFKLLADSGDEILCPVPSYPLFHYIAKMASVRMAYYPVAESPNSPFWHLNWEQLEHCITTKTKAIVLISPHNPTGLVLDQIALEKIAEISSRFHIPLIQDEVFSEFVWDKTALGAKGYLARAAQTHAPLVFTLNGLSKIFALPGIKLGWILIHGENELTEMAKDRLKMISDTFLPVNESVQQTLPLILGEGQRFTDKLKVWIKSRLDQALSILSRSSHLTVLNPMGGFYLVLRLREGLPNADDLSVELLKTRGILLHPGSFYEMKGNHFVFSFLHAEKVLEEALQGLVAFLESYDVEK